MLQRMESAPQSSDSIHKTEEPPFVKTEIAQTMAKYIAYAKEHQRIAAKRALQSDLEQPVETSLLQMYAELGLLTSIAAGKAVERTMEKNRE